MMFVQNLIEPSLHDSSVVPLELTRSSIQRLRRFCLPYLHELGQLKTEPLFMSRSAYTTPAWVFSALGSLSSPSVVSTIPRVLFFVPSEGDSLTQRLTLCVSRATSSWCKKFNDVSNSSPTKRQWRSICAFNRDDELVVFRSIRRLRMNALSKRS